MATSTLGVEYDDWHADHDHMGKRLHVYGNCTVNGGGFAVELEPHERQGANERMLMLGIRFVPTGESPSRQAVEYRQDWDDDSIPYDEVGFVTVGDAEAPPPSQLQIRDIY